MEHNPDIMLYAARALTFMADVMPPSCGAIVRHGAVSQQQQAATAAAAAPFWQRLWQEPGPARGPAAAAGQPAAAAMMPGAPSSRRGATDR
jgi:hypothetical protein